jgi:hypothetical protein
MLKSRFDRKEKYYTRDGRNTWLVVAWMTPIGRVTTEAKAKAKSIPHHGSCTSTFHTKDIIMDSAMLPNNTMRNHHSGTVL